MTTYQGNLNLLGLSSAITCLENRADVSAPTPVNASLSERTPPGRVRHPPSLLSAEVSLLRKIGQKRFHLVYRW